jgi:hydroxymethylpyrimidine/phosphomethylpyrimidine kinase
VKIYKALTIAGSDSGAGAGLQADLKTFAALGVYGTSVVTAITAQNTTGVTQVLETPAPLVAAQIDAVLDDIGADAVKTGMLGNARIIRTVADKIRQHGIQHLVIDPVMIAKGGQVLLRPDAIQTLQTRLFPLATVVTPNIPEAQALTSVEGVGVRAIQEMARRIFNSGAKNVVIKGGHRRGPATDILYDGSVFLEFPAARIRTKNTHGTGCTFAAALACGLARRLPVEVAVAAAKEFVTQAIRRAFAIGAGHSPVNHFYSSFTD